MPVYEFVCRSCGHRFEEFNWSSTDAAGVACPECGGTEARKVMSVFGIGRGDTTRSASMDGSAPCGPGCACHGGAGRRMPTAVS
jgi:putative FmdB family regulatory protein